jgi:NADH-quinone oxidoreductase subunit D
MRRSPVRACMRPTIVRAAFIAICRTACRSTPKQPGKREDLKVLNEARSGSLLDFLEDFTNRFPTYLGEYHTLLTDNRIWKQRLVGMGVVEPERALQMGFPGHAARFRHRLGSAQEAALRGLRPVDFDIPVGVNGDSYDRYLVRMEEMLQSNHIIKQCIDWLRKNPGPVITDNYKVAPPPREA